MIPEPGSGNLIADLLSMDLGGGGPATAAPGAAAPLADLLGGGLDQLLGGGVSADPVAGQEFIHYTLKVRR